MTRPCFLNLTAEEEGRVKALQEAVAHEIQALPSLQAFCTHSCYVRYLRARAWNVHKATKMLQDTLKWRANYKPELIRWEDVAHEARDGKMYVLEHPDKEGRPVVLMRPRNETSTNNDTRLKYLVYTLEHASRLADDWADDGKMAWLVDFVGYSRKNAPPIKIALQTLHILQSHYPERLGKAVSFQPPLVFDLLWRAVSPFIDPVTRKKLVFLNKKEAAAGHMAQHFNMEHLDGPLGGSMAPERSFNLARLEERYRQSEAATDRVLAAAADAAPPQQAAAEAAPSPGASASSAGSSVGDEVSGSVAAATAASAGCSNEWEGEHHVQDEAERGVGEVAAGVGALKVA